MASVSCSYLAPPSCSSVQDRWRGTPPLNHFLSFLQVLLARGSVPRSPRALLWSKRQSSFLRHRAIWFQNGYWPVVRVPRYEYSSCFVPTSSVECHVVSLRCYLVGHSLLIKLIRFPGTPQASTGLKYSGLSPSISQLKGHSLIPSFLYLFSLPCLIDLRFIFISRGPSWF